MDDSEIGGRVGAGRDETPGDAGMAGDAGMDSQAMEALLDGEQVAPSRKARLAAYVGNDHRLRQAAGAVYDEGRLLPPAMAAMADELATALRPDGRSGRPGQGLTAGQDWTGRAWLAVSGRLPLASGLLLALVLGWWIGASSADAPGSTPSSVFIDEAKDVHLAASLVPGYGTPADPEGLARIAAAFAQRIEPPDLGPEGLRLAGVDVVPTDIGPALLFGYLDESGQRYTLVLSFAEELRGPDSGTPAHPLTAAHGGLVISYWHDGVAAYALVAAAAPPRLAGIARSIAAARSA